MLGGLSCVSVGNGLLGLLISLRMKIEGFDEDAIGLTVSAYAIGFFAGSFFVPRIIRAFRHAPTLGASVLIFAVAAALFPLWTDPVYWFVLRFVTGAAAAGAFVVGESWLNESAGAAGRGRAFSLYMITGRLAGAAGQLMLAFGDVSSSWLFLLSAFWVALAIMPVSRLDAQPMTQPDLTAFSPFKLYRISPVGMVGCFVSGLNNVALIGLAPAFAKERGFDDWQAALFTACVMVGNLLLQYPIARMAERRDRRHVLIGACAFSILAAGLLPLSVGGFGGVFLFPLAAFFGGISSTFYPLCVAHGASRAEPRQIVAVNGGLLTIWSAGAIIGPILAGAIMARVGPDGLFWYLMTTCTVLLFFTARRLRARPSA